MGSPNYPHPSASQGQPGEVDAIKASSSTDLAGGKSVLNRFLDAFFWNPIPISDPQGPLGNEFESAHRAGSLSGFVRKSDSEYGILDPFMTLFAQPPQRTAVRPKENSNNLLVDLFGISAWNNNASSPSGFGSHSDFIHKSTSEYGVLDADEYAIAPPQHTAVRRPQRSTNLFSDVSTQLSDSAPKTKPAYRINVEAPRHTYFPTKNREVKQLAPLTVTETTSIYEAWSKMARAGGSDVVVVGDQLDPAPRGILTSKDIVSRVIATGIDFVNTNVSKVMTNNPTCVFSETPVVEALRMMVQGEVSQLPVIENGKVIGLVHLPRCLFDVMANTGTIAENDKIISSLRQKVDRCNHDFVAHSEHGHRGFTVKQLGLQKVLTLPQTTNIYKACCHMAAETADVVVLTDSNALLSGILTNKDIVSRVIASEIDFVKTPVSKVMTVNPTFVSSDTLVVEALQKMVQGEVTQLPVIEEGKVIGLVYLLVCLLCVKGTTESHNIDIVEPEEESIFFF